MKVTGKETCGKGMLYTRIIVVEEIGKFRDNEPNMSDKMSRKYIPGSVSIFSSIGYVYAFVVKKDSQMKTHYIITYDTKVPH